MADYNIGTPATMTRQNGVTERLFNGVAPVVSTGVHKVAASQTIRYREPVMFNADQELVPAVYGTPAIGISLADVETGVADTVTVEVIRAGCLNPAALVWPVSYDTAAKRATAFEGAPTPTQIKLQANA